LTAVVGPCQFAPPSYRRDKFTREEQDQRLIMTTTTSALPAPAERVSWAALIWIGSLHVAALLAFVPAFFSWSGLAMCLVLHWLTGGIGICMTYHRLLTHRSFAVRPSWLEYVLTAVGCCASEGGPISWVADHRKHHAHSDDDNDTHTPLQGFLWAHMFWWMKTAEDRGQTPEYYLKWCPDLYRDPVHRWLDKWHIIFPLAMFAGLYAIGGMSWLVWGGFVRSVFVLHSTWLVNSASHVWGYRTHPTRDLSTNLWWVALLTYGEGWHNNHHAFQTSARHGLRWWEIDMTYLAIKSMQLCRIAYNIRLVKPRAIAPEAPMVAMSASVS
jgi:fatty-acid desaturase